MGMISNWLTDFGFLAMAGAQAIGAGVAAADDHHALARGQNLTGNLVAGDALVLLRQKLHGEVNAFELAAGDFQVAGSFGAAGQQNRVEFLAQIFDGHVVAHVRVGLEIARLRRPSDRGGGRGRAFPS